MRMIVSMFIMLAVLSTTNVFAQCAPSCASAKKVGCAAAQKEKVCGWKECDTMVSQIELTEEQKSQLAEIKATCASDTSDDATQKWCEAMDQVLTPEQKEELKGMCKTKGMTCPMMKETQQTPTE